VCHRRRTAGSDRDRVLTVTHGKVVGTKLQFADYAGMARSFGMHAERVETDILPLAGEYFRTMYRFALTG
jgi:hypothetical protein